MKRKTTAGITSFSVPIKVFSTASTTGAGLTGLTSATSGLVAEYRRQGQSTWTAISLVGAPTKSIGTWTSGGFLADGSRGAYELDLPNAAMAAGARFVLVRLYGAANMLDVDIEIELDAVDYQTAALGAALATHWTSTRAGYLDSVLIAANSNRTVQVTGSNHVAADIHELQPAVITAADFAPGAIDANALAADAVVEIRTGLGLSSANLDTQLAGIQSDTNDIQSTLATLAGYVDTEIAAIKSVTDKLNTGLVADGAVFQFTANMLELAPAAAGGGSATIENQELILNELDTLRSSFAAAVGRLAVASQIVGFPAALVRNSDYSTVTESEIRLSLNDLDGNPITEIGGVPCDEIEWLFGLGSERAPAIIEGAATWDNANSQLVIQIDADDTAATPLGTLSWQIGCTIDTTTRYLGGGTTRLIERQF